MRPTSFWQRLRAYLIDMIVLLPLALVALAAVFISPRLGITLHAFLSPAAFLYAAYFIAKRGQTIGKRISQIKVVRLDGSDVSTGQAVLRGLIDLFFAVALGISSFLASTAMLAEQIQDGESKLSLEEVVRVLNAGQSEGPGQIISILSVVYALAQLICFFSTPERRFIHDLVASTRVIRVDGVQNDAAIAANQGF